MDLQLLCHARKVNQDGNRLNKNDLSIYRSGDDGSS